jgi:hypothetical protein
VTVARNVKFSTSIFVNNYKFLMCIKIINTVMVGNMEVVFDNVQVDKLFTET